MADQTILKEHQYVDEDGIPHTMRAVIIQQNETYEARIEDAVVWGDLVTYHPTFEAAASRALEYFHDMLDVDTHELGKGHITLAMRLIHKYYSDPANPDNWQGRKTG
jgi:hypothetical protein